MFWSGVTHSRFGPVVVTFVPVFVVDFVIRGRSLPQECGTYDLVQAAVMLPIVFA